MRPRPTALEPGPLVITAIVSTALGVLLAATEASDRALLLAAIAAVLVAPLVVRVATGTFDMFEPLVWLNVALAVMFFAHPVALLAYDTLHDWHDSYSVDATFNRALVVVLVGILAMYAGYFSRLAGRVGRAAPPLPDDSDADVVQRLAWILIALGVTGYVVYAIGAGASPGALIFGGAGLGDASRASAYLYMAPYLTVPASLLLIRSGMLTQQLRRIVTGVVVAVLLLLSIAPSGQRLNLLLLIGALAIYPMVRTGWRPRPWLAVIVAVAGLTLIISMRDLASRADAPALGESVRVTVQEPGPALREFITGPDTEMFSALAVELQVLPSQLGYHPGFTVTSLLAQPVPRQLWPGKPRFANTYLNGYLLDVEQGEAGAAYSVVGELYYDLGLVTVVLGMFVVGALFRALWEYRLANRANDMVAMLFAAALPYAVVLMRGNFADSLARSLFTVVPIVIVALLAARRTEAMRASAKQPLR